MATPSEKLADALEAPHALQSNSQQENGVVDIRSSRLSRTRLLASLSNGTQERGTHTRWK